MVTGLIVFVICIAVLPTAIGKGEWGVVAVVAVVSLLLLWGAALGREHDRAYNNAVSYWAKGGPDRKRNRNGR